MMLFSIVTVCFNSAKTIRQTFDSVLQQECFDYEYIVVDGASSDGTVDIIKEYEPKFAGRMRWISEPDTGIYNAMNKGIRLAGGEFVAFIGSDDYYEPHAFKKMAAAIQANPDFNIYYGIVRTLQPQNDKLEHMLVRHSHLFITGFSLMHQGVFTSRKLMLDSGLFDESFRITADYDFFLRVFLNNTGLFFPVDDIIAAYRQTGVSASAALRRSTNTEYWRVQFKNHRITLKQFRIRLLQGNIAWCKQMIRSCFKKILGM